MGSKQEGLCDPPWQVGGSTLLALDVSVPIFLLHHCLSHLTVRTNLKTFKGTPSRHHQRITQDKIAHRCLLNSECLSPQTMLADSYAQLEDGVKSEPLVTSPTSVRLPLGPLGSDAT